MNRLALAIFGLLLLTAVAAALFLGGDDVKAADGGAALSVLDNPGENSPGIARLEESSTSSDREKSSLTAESAPSTVGEITADVVKSPLVFRGVVLDASRKPVKGAEVTAVRASGAQKPLSETASTGDDGRFVVGLPERQGWGWRLEARAGGFAPSYLTQVPSWLPDIDVGPIILYTATSVQGTVADRDGRPVQGAKLFVYTVSSTEDGDDDGFSMAEYKPVAVSGVDGKYTIPSLPPGKVSLGAQADGYADGVRPGVLLTLERPNEADFTLVPEEPLKGTVVDEIGSTVAKAKVRGRIDNARNAFWRRPIETDSQGKFVLGGLDRTRRQLNLQVQKAGFTVLWQDGSHLPADERYILRKGAQVRVKVEASGRPAPPAIRAVRFERRNARSNRWNGWGEVPKSQREIVDQAQWLVTTEMRGPARVMVFTEDGSSGTSSEFDIPQGTLSAPIEISVEIQPAAVAAGRVVGPDLTPLADLRLEYSCQDRGANFLRIATTNDKGQFQFDGIPAGAGTVVLRSPNWISETLKVETRAGEKTEGLELTARKPSKISGRLTIGGATPGEPIPITFYKVIADANQGYWQHLGLATANERGEYTFSPAPPGRIALVPKRKIDTDTGSIRDFDSESQHPEWNDEERDRWQWIVEVAPESEARRDLDLPISRPSIIRGQVLVNNEPRAGMDIWTYSERGGDSRSDTTNAEGKFKFKLDKAGEYQVQLWGDGFSEMRKATVGEGDEKELVIQLSAGGIEGSIVDKANQGLSLRVRLERQRDKNASSENYWYETPEQLTKADGGYAFTEAVAGNYRILVQDYRNRYAHTASAVFTIGAKERLTVPQMHIPLASPIVVNAKNAEGKPVSGTVLVSAAPNSDPLPRRAMNGSVGRQGSGRVNGVRPGAVIVKFQPSGSYTGSEQTVTLPGDGSETVVNFEVKKKEGAVNTADPVNGDQGPVHFLPDGSQIQLRSGLDFDDDFDWDFGEFNGVSIQSYGGGG